MKESSEKTNGMTSNQRTIARETFVDGFGFWTGQDVRVSFRPASEDSGVRFFRTDLPDSPPIPADVAYRVRKPRQTSLANQNAQVDMIEHILAAVRAAGIDNCDIAMNGAEAPGCDGSSLSFFLALKEAGSREQSRPRLVKKVSKVERFGDENAWIEVRPSNDEKTVFGYRLVYETSPERKHPIGNQECRFELTTESFERELTSSRTFLLYEEAEYLLSNGLCRRVSPKDVLVFNENGPIENSLRYPNECARHKVLDMIGDFALSKYHWVGEFFACRTGHQQNADALQKLLEIF